LRELEIESDPNAEGFYKRMGARRVGTVTRELAGFNRNLPILVYYFGEAVSCEVHNPATPQETYTSWRTVSN